MENDRSTKGPMTRAGQWGRLVLLGLVLIGGGILDGGRSLAQETEEGGGAQEREAGADVAVRLQLSEEALPEEPFAPAWDRHRASTFRLSPQVHWPERLLDATVKEVTVRGVHDGERLAVLVEYQDPTEDAHDAAALEFMVGDQKAHFAHGQEMMQVEGGPVNIWYWRNKDGKAVDLAAEGFGTLRPQAHQDVSAKAEWRDGTWRIMFVRPLQTEHPAQDVQIVPGEWTNVAFAVWDGKLTGTGEPKEKGSQKAVSSWWYFRAEPVPDYSVFIYAALGLGIAALFELALVKRLKKGQAA